MLKTPKYGPVPFCQNNQDRISARVTTGSDSAPGGPRNFPYFSAKYKRIEHDYKVDNKVVLVNN